MICSTLTSCLDDICPLSSRPARAALLTPGYPMFFVSIRPNSGQQRENGANQKIHQTWVGISLCFHLSLLTSTLPNYHISTTRSTALQTHVIFRTYLIISSVPSTTSHHFYNSWWLCHFFTDKTRTISSQFSTHTGPPTNHIHC